MGDFDWSRKNEYTMQSLMDILDIRLREIIREEKGGTYGVSIWSDIYRIPTSRYSTNIEFGCDPKRVEELTKAVFSVIDSVKTFGTANETLAKVKETQKRQYEVNIKNNYYWLNTIMDYLKNNDNTAEIQDYQKWVDDLKMNDIIETCSKYITNNYVKITLLPEAN
jgi:zinc protease